MEAGKGGGRETRWRSRVSSGHCPEDLWAKEDTGLSTTCNPLQVPWKDLGASLALVFSSVNWE